MATISNQPNPTQKIAEVLGDLRRRIGRYVLIEGFALVVVAMGVVFWFTLGIDTAWFGFRKLELPMWFRVGAMILGVVAILALVARYVVFRMARQYQQKDLALVLERRFPELNDGLITAVEMADDETIASQSVTNSMLVRTVTRVSENVRKLPIESVFATGPLRKALIGAVAMVISVGVLSVAKGNTVNRWWDAFVLYKPVYWERTTQLRVRAIVQPGDRVREFRYTDGSDDESGPAMELLHPRNTDLTILIESDDTEEQQWEVPDRVRLDLSRPTNRKRVYLSQLDGGKFRYSIDKLNGSVELHVQGGDFAHELPFRVRVVDPPRIDSVALKCEYPEYTGWNETHETDLAVTGTQAELPIETRFDFVASTNKPLVGFHLEVGNTQLTLADGEAVVKIGGEGGEVQRTTQLPDEVAATFVSGDARTIQLPLFITNTETTSDGDRICIPPDSMLRFYLHDEDDIVSAEPIVLRIMSIADEPPSVECERQGVGDAITRIANVPISGMITDDYGIANARFEFKVDAGEEWRPRRFRSRAVDRPMEFQLGADEGRSVERFNVRVLSLDEGQKLTLTVYAEDANDTNGPNIGRSQKFEFRIVSNEELLSLLYGREINLRRRFEEVISQVQGVRDDLVKHRDRFRRLPNVDQAEADLINTAVASCASRSLNTVRKNGNETRSIEVAFADIVDELINNAIPPQSLAEEMRRSIVRPLNVINVDDFPTVDTALGSFKLATERETVRTDQIDASIAAVDQTLAHMKILLDEIKDLAELHEIVKDLKQLIDAQREIYDKTKALQKKKLIEKLKLGDDDDE
ncbi:MAG: hypothetical protein AB8G99_26135 [Planctomycetaceae bacterium]